MQLSFILCSRNDEYMGNSRWRLQTTLNCLGDRVRALGRLDDVEVIVADWGSAVPLRTAIALEPPAAAIVSFLTIPRDVARARQGDSAFPEVIALNAAARRARGRFIGRIDQDTIVGDRFLRWFFDTGAVETPPAEAAAGPVWFANRRDIPYRFAARGPARRHVDRFVRVFGRRLPIARRNRWFHDVFWSASVGIWLVPRAVWHECRGYDERLIHYNWMETDMVRRLSRTYPVGDLGLLTGYDFYHLDHHHPRTPPAARMHDRKNPDLDPASPVPPMAPNGAAWGLAECDLALQPIAAGGVDAGHAGGAREAAAFVLLAARVAVDVAVDRVVVAAARIATVTRRRAAAASRGLAGQPIQLWPGTLWKLWHGRKMNRAR
jgi:hypothetical protein